MGRKRVGVGGITVKRTNVSRSRVYKSYGDYRKKIKGLEKQLSDTKKKLSTQKKQFDSERKELNKEIRKLKRKLISIDKIIKK